MQLKELVDSIVGDCELSVLNDYALNFDYELNEERYRCSGFTVVCLPHYLCCGRIQSSYLVAAWWNCIIFGGCLVAAWYIICRIVV